MAVGWGVCTLCRPRYRPVAPARALTPFPPFAFTKQMMQTAEITSSASLARSQASARGELRFARQMELQAQLSAQSALPEPASTHLAKTVGFWGFLDLAACLAGSWRYGRSETSPDRANNGFQPKTRRNSQAAREFCEPLKEGLDCHPR